MKKEIEVRGQIRGQLGAITVTEEDKKLINEAVAYWEGKCLLDKAAAKSGTLDDLAQNQGNVQQDVYDNFRDIGLVHVGQWFAANPKVNTQGWNGGGQQAMAFGWWQLVGQ